MKYHQLGLSDLKASEIGFGCMSLDKSDARSGGLLLSACDAGINYFDTADLYDAGENEKLVGAALKKRRKEVIIATKVGNQLNADKKSWSWNPSAAYIMEAVEQSLKRLQTDYIDLYQLHGGTLQDPIDETIAAFEKLVAQGKIRYYGISSIRPNVIREYIQRSTIISVMLQYSLLDRRPEEEVLPLLKEHRKAVMVRGGLAKGLLAGKAPAVFLNYNEEEVKQAAYAIKSVCNDQRKASHTALKFTLQHPAVTTAVVGIRTAGQLEEAIAATKAPDLTEEELTYLRAGIPVNYYQEHR